MKKSFIVDGVRTPIGSFGGSLAPIRTDDLAAIVLKELANKFPTLDLEKVYDVILGCANQSGEDNRNIARMALLLAGYPISVPGETVNRLCASGLNAAANASRLINTGEANLVVAGGVESMTRGPWVISKTSSAFGRDAQMFDSSFGWRFINQKMKEKYGVDAMGETAENLAEHYKISREDQDKFSLWSQQKAAIATTNGRLKKEIIPVSIPQKKGEAIIFENDEFIKPKTTLEGLNALKTSFKKDGTVTAGNASGLNDGAAAMLMASEDGLNDNNLEPLAEIISIGISGVEPRIMGIGPVKASQIALERAGLTMDKIDLIELNEAFAAQVLSCTRSLGIEDFDNRLNPNGGAIALGHPLGMSGSRLLISAAKELKLKNLNYALITMCIGVGQGYAMIIKKV
ncbi:MAG: 3-oxoadipyl-CoA thiolase [Bacteroidota bacterium]